MAFRAWLLDAKRTKAQPGRTERTIEARHTAMFYTRHTDTGTRCVTLYGTGMMWVWVLRQQYCPKTAISLEYHIIIWVAGGCSFFMRCTLNKYI